MAKNGHNAKAIAHAKYITLGQKIKMPKIGAKNDSTTTLELLLCKKPARKNSLIFEK